MDTTASLQHQSLDVQLPPVSKELSARVISLSDTVWSPWPWMTSFARASILSFLQSSIKFGSLELVDGEQSHSFGEYTKGDNHVRLFVVNNAFWMRVFISGDLGFSEAYMIGDIQVDDLRSVMDLWLDNRSDMAGLSSFAHRVLSTVSGLTNGLMGQTRPKSQLNAIASYDQSNKVYKAFLSKEMMYSSALFSNDEGGVHGDLKSGYIPDQLEAAQTRKLRHVLTKARVKPGHRLLEFGSGWGGLAIEAAKSFGCEVDTLTLSIEQKILAEERIRAAGLEDRIRVHLMDYRDLPPEFEKAFDAFVSIEMLEHVGTKYYTTFFKLIDWALKPDKAAAVVTSTTRPESRYTEYQAEDFGRRYMWPNGSLPSVLTLIKAAHSASQGRFVIDSAENHAAHYARTLREWGYRLEANLTHDLIRNDYPLLQTRAEYEAFRRKWEYMFAYAGQGFAKGYVNSHMLTFIRENDGPVE